MEEVDYRIRHVVKSSITRAALKSSNKYLFGFLLGNFSNSSIVFEYPLISGLKDNQDETNFPEILEFHLGAANQVAIYSETEILGAFITRDFRTANWRTRPYDMLSFSLNLAKSLELPFVSEFLVEYEHYYSILGINLFYTQSFPSKLPYKILEGRRSIQKNHNLRRIRSLWQSLVESGAS
jgi:hypothetical protein